MIAIGYILGAKIVRKNKEKFSWTGKLQTIVIIILVLVMGMRMGANREIIDNLGTIGIYAVVFTAIVLAVTFVLVCVIRRVMGYNKVGEIIDKAKEGGAKSHKKAERTKTKINRMTILIVLAVVFGMLMGFYLCLLNIEKGLIFGGDVANFDRVASLVIKIGLCVLLFFVGTDLGVEGTVFQKIREAGLRIIVFPVVVILAAVIGSIISALIMPISVKEALAIGCGFGWYTLAPGIIMEAGYVTASAISFLHNVLRELLAILLIPAIANNVGYIEAATFPGAPSMDVCLPIIAKATKPSMVVYAFVTGLIMSLLVPILVPIIVA